MKTKRCTNSSCRKVFKVENTTCPHCGKQYPRQIPAFDKHGRFTVVLTYWGISKLAGKQFCTGLGESRGKKFMADGLQA